MIRITDAGQIGPAIADLRAMYGLRQRDLCEQTGIWQGRLSAYERGTEIPALRTLLTLLGGLDLGLEIVPLGEKQAAIDPRWEQLIEGIASRIRQAVRDGAVPIDTQEQP